MVELFGAFCISIVIGGISAGTAVYMAFRHGWWAGPELGPPLGMEVFCLLVFLFATAATFFTLI